MFNFAKWRARKRLSQQLTNDVINGIYYFELSNGDITKVDPLLAYVKLKEHGFDVFNDEIEGVIHARPGHTKAFLKAICETFNVSEYDCFTGKGITVLDALRLYLGFYRFLLSLKKNVPFLQEYLPFLERRIEELANFTRIHKDSSSTTGYSSSDTTSTSSNPQSSQDYQPSMAQAEQSTD